MGKKKTKVVHCKKDSFDVYIGRPKGKEQFHFGNPFTWKAGTKASVVLPEGTDCIEAFREWLEGTDYQDVEPERRQWILDNLHTLKGKTIACWCKPLACHGDVLAELADL